jgi:hypothetical protein
MTRKVDGDDCLLGNQNEALGDERSAENDHGR